jgi:hypothetical protein
MMYAMMMSQVSHEKACTAEQRLAILNAVRDKNAGQILEFTES